jgi:nucleotide-binding universal stress UspA family protein
MNALKILVPIDITSCPLEVFDLVNGFAKRPEVAVILLYVVNLNIVSPENRVYEEIGQESQWFLEQLAHKYVHPNDHTVVRVRVGKPDEEILAEATEQKADLIILTTRGHSWRRRLASFWKRQPGWAISRLVERTIRESTCGVFIANGKTRFNCEKAWGRPVSGIEGALNARITGDPVAPRKNATGAGVGPGTQFSAGALRWGT